MLGTWELIFSEFIASEAKIKIPRDFDTIFVIIEASSSSFGDFAGMLLPTFQTPIGEIECKGIGVRRNRREMIYFPHPIPVPYQLEFRAKISSEIKIWKLVGELNQMATTNPIVFPEAPKSTNSNVSSIAASIESQIAIAANANRKGATLTNASSGKCYIACFSVANSANYVSELQPGGHYELDPTNYTGNISVIWPEAASGSLLVTEFV